MRGAKKAGGGVYDWDLDYRSPLMVYAILNCFVALALLLAVVKKGDAYLFHRLGGCSGGVRSLSSPCPLVL